LERKPAAGQIGAGKQRAGREDGLNGIEGKSSEFAGNKRTKEKLTAGYEGCTQTGGYYGCPLKQKKNKKRGLIGHPLKYRGWWKKQGSLNAEKSFIPGEEERVFARERKDWGTTFDSRGHWKTGRRGVLQKAKSKLRRGKGEKGGKTALSFVERGTSVSRGSPGSLRHEGKA